MKKPFLTSLSPRESLQEPDLQPSAPWNSRRAESLVAQGIKTHLLQEHPRLTKRTNKTQESIHQRKTLNSSLEIRIPFELSGLSAGSHVHDLRRQACAVVRGALLQARTSISERSKSKASSALDKHTREMPGKGRPGCSRSERLSDTGSNTDKDGQSSERPSLPAQGTCSRSQGGWHGCCPEGDACLTMLPAAVGQILLLRARGVDGRPEGASRAGEGGVNLCRRFVPPSPAIFWPRSLGRARHPALSPWRGAERAATW